VSAAGNFQRATRMAFSQADYSKYLDEMAEVEISLGFKPIYHLHTRRWNRSIKQWLLDPGYKIKDQRLERFIQQRITQGVIFGLHPSFDSWKSAAALTEDRESLEEIIGQPIKHVRQHWLRFSWLNTPKAQAEAGLSRDSTIGFNDRPGFRCAAALEYSPWNLETGAITSLLSCPLILMDSHLYSYQRMRKEESD